MAITATTLPQPNSTAGVPFDGSEVELGARMQSKVSRD